LARALRLGAIDFVGLGWAKRVAANFDSGFKVRPFSGTFAVILWGIIRLLVGTKNEAAVR
jgi:hypothetical protein